jgi:hypothetical protein
MLRWSFKSFTYQACDLIVLHIEDDLAGNGNKQITWSESRPASRAVQLNLKHDASRGIMPLHFFKVKKFTRRIIFFAPILNFVLFHWQLCFKGQQREMAFLAYSFSSCFG